MKKLLITLILLMAAGGGGWAYYNKYVKVEDKASVTQQPISVGNIIQQVQATGTLEALRTVQVGSQVSGVVKKLYVDFNSMVHEGQLLAELDPSLLQVQVDIQDANIARQVGDIEQQKVQLENDQLNLTRTQTQADKGLVSAQTLEAAKLQVKSRESQIASADKQLVQARASLSQAKLNVAYCRIISPIDGVIVNRAVDEGQTVQSSVNVATFFTIATELTTLKLSAGIDEAEIGFIRRNMPVTFQVDSYGTKNFYGNVDAVRLNATIQSNVVTYPVWITVQNPDYELRPSMTANLKIMVDRADQVLRVPNQALRFNPTSDIYTWLGMPAPAPGQGRGRGANALAGPGGGPAGAATGTVASATPGARPGAAPGTAPGATAPGAKPGPGQQANADALAGGNTRRQRDPNAQPGQGGGRGGFGTGQPGQDLQANAAGSRGRQRDPNAPMGQGGGRGGQNPGGGRGGGGRGFGQNSFQNMTPEQIAAMRAAGGGRGGGRGGNGAGGPGGGRGARVGNDTPAATAAMAAGKNATKIDELFEPIVKPNINGRVWVYNEKAADPKDKLKQISVRLGLTDSTFSQLISGEGLTAGSMIVTSVVPPPSAVKALQANPSNFFNQQNRGGPGGNRGGRGGN